MADSLGSEVKVRSLLAGNRRPSNSGIPGIWERQGSRLSSGSSGGRQPNQLLVFKKHQTNVCGF